MACSGRIVAVVAFVLVITLILSDSLTRPNFDSGIQDHVSNNSVSMSINTLSSTKLNSSLNGQMKTRKPTTRGLLLAGGLGVLSGFMVGSVISVIIVFCFFRCNNDGVLEYDKKVQTYRGGDGIDIPD